MDTRERIEAVRARLRELQIDERLAEGFGPPCLECAHVLTDREGPGCGHIVYAKRVLTIETGEIREEYRTPASWARAEDGLCGPEGLLFEPLPITQKLRRALTKQNGGNLRR